MTGVLGFVVIVGGSLLLTLLGVVLAFVVIAVWENYAATREIADHEASAVGALYRLANGFPDPHRAAAQEALLTYAETVIEVAWPAMANGEDPTVETSAALDELYAVYHQPAFVAAVNPEQYGESLDQLDEVSVTRRERVLASDSGLPT